MFGSSSISIGSSGHGNSGQNINEVLFGKVAPWNLAPVTFNGRKGGMR